MTSHWLSLAVWVPIVAGLIVLAVGERNHGGARWVARLIAVAGFLVTIPLVTGFQTGTSAMQFVELSSWIPRFNVNYHLGVDGISVLFILLNSFITNALQIPVVIVPEDATAMGNILVQAIALGQVSSLEEARRIVRESSRFETIQPSAVVWNTAFERLEKLT